MPGSAPEGKEFIKQWISEQPDILTVVDVGCGQGTYADLLKDVRDPLFHLPLTMIGIEAWEPYITQFKLTEKYSKIIVSDIRNMNEFPEAECIILGDVLEHMTEKEVMRLLRVIPYEHIIVSVPLGHWPQGAVNGNPYERHLMEFDMRKAEAIFNFPIKRQEGAMGIFIK